MSSEARTVIETNLTPKRQISPDLLDHHMSSVEAMPQIVPHAAKRPHRQSHAPASTLMVGQFSLLEP